MNRESQTVFPSQFWSYSSVCEYARSVRGVNSHLSKAILNLHGWRINSSGRESLWEWTPYWAAAGGRDEGSELRAAWAQKVRGKRLCHPSDRLDMEGQWESFGELDYSIWWETLGNGQRNQLDIRSNFIVDRASLFSSEVAGGGSWDRSENARSHSSWNCLIFDLQKKKEVTRPSSTTSAVNWPILLKIPPTLGFVFQFRTSLQYIWSLYFEENEPWSLRPDTRIDSVYFLPPIGMNSSQ